MKKLDEIMELMADEMADFKTAVLQLQGLSEQLSELSIPISTEALEKNLNAFLKKQELESQERDEILKSIDQRLKNARIIPNYLLILFGALGILALGLIGYFSYSANAHQEESFELYRILMESGTHLQQDFFATHPEIKEVSPVAGNSKVGFVMTNHVVANNPLFTVNLLETLENRQIFTVNHK